jgi:hypothetical protein
MTDAKLSLERTIWKKWKKKGRRGGARPGAGRPKGILRPYKKITIAFPEEFVPVLKGTAKERGISMSKLIQGMVAKTIAKES